MSNPSQSVLSRPRTSALRMSQRQRLTIGAVLGLSIGVVAAVVTPWQLAGLAGWDAAALFILISVWMFIPRLDGAATKASANREDLSTVNDDFVMLAASVISLVGVILALVAAKHLSGGLKASMTAIAVFTVVVSWAVVHTLFTLRYAHLYYDEPDGGIEFVDESAPDYLDFVYFAFTIGMTFQVSDTDITSRSIRRAVTRHALLGYVFGTVIIGVTINVVGGLIS